jgi:lipoprotein-anchoring transpeptidase ErfK/SrfK
MFNSSTSSHITVAQKYNITEKQFGTSYNFKNIKIRGNNRFVGLISNGDYSGIALGVNDDASGVTIQEYI